MMGVLGKQTLQTYIPATTGFARWYDSGSTDVRAIKTTNRVCEWVDLPWATDGSDRPNTRRSAKRVKICGDVTNIEYVYTTDSGRSTSTDPQPAKTTYNFQIGWNARAHSLYPLVAAGEYTFSMPASVAGVVVGLTDRPQTSGFADILYGFQQVGKSVKIMEAGAVVETLGDVPAASFSIKRINGTIEYRVNDVLERTVDDYPVTMWLSAALYSGGDSVIDADMDVFGEANLSGESAPMAGMFNDGSAYAFIVGDTMPMAGEFSAKNRAELAGVARRMTGIFRDAGGYSILAGSAPAPAGSLDAYGSLPYCTMAGFTPAAEGFFTSLSGSLGSMHGESLPMTGLFSDYAYCFVDGESTPANGMFSAIEAADEAYVVEFMEPEWAIDASTLLFVVVDSSMSITGLVSVQQVLSAMVSSSTSIGNTLTTTQVLQALVESLMRASALDGNDQEGMSVWALNLDVNGSTRYENYDFNSFAVIDGVAYGAKSDGIYRLEGPDDNGTDIAARVNFGNLSFGSMARKALPYVYAGVASNGKLVLKVVADGQTFLYTVRDNTEMLKAHRFEPGRGLRASYYDLELQNEGGSAFDLSSIEFQTIELTRRL
jgi:hypothetical protein